MSVRIQFDKPNAYAFTNLDLVTGRVILTLPSDATIAAINVKLEGESRSRLAGPRFPQDTRSDKKRTELEVHKLLYKVQTVFPTPSIQSQSSPSTQYTLLAGQYEYPFSFKVPFNNSCTNDNRMLRDLKLGSLNVQIAPDTNVHVRRGLPPTLSGFPGEAEIKYYVKVTVQRPKFYQENLRYQVDIKFFPIEPPRPPNRNEETYARRQQQFQKGLPQPAKKSLFRKSSLPDPDDDTPSFQVDARLPNPAIITCHAPLPLRILVQKLNTSSANVFLSMLQIELIAFTLVRAHDLNRTETSTWVLMSQANMNMPLGNPADRETMEWKIPSRYWENIPLPNTVAPSFETCNLTRKYELEVRIGLAHGAATGLRPELIVLPLRLPVSVYSGIAPPPELLALAHQPHPLPIPNIQTPTNGSPDNYGHWELQTPTSASFDYSNHTPAQIGYFNRPSTSSGSEQPPPSYEDAMAEDIGPVDGPRHDYNVPADPEGTETAFPTDRKGSGSGNGSGSGSGLRRNLSERLFSQNAPRRPGDRGPMTESSLHTSGLPGHGMITEEETDSPSSTSAVVGHESDFDIPPPQPPRPKPTDWRRSEREV